MENFRFPMFVDLRGQKVLVVGGGPVALRRVGVLLKFGAQVIIIAPQCPKVPKGAVHLPRAYEPGDLSGAFLAVAATNDRSVNHQVGLDAKALGIPVSVADCKEECTFFFPAICQGEGLVAGVISDGSDHKKTARAAKAIRSVLEELS